MVISGEHRGAGLGYPTANLAIAAGLVTPGNGVYAVQVQIGSMRYQGVANVGVNPTFEGTSRHIEVFLLNFSGDLYGQIIAVDFLKKLRNEKIFAGVDQLIAQIRQDIETARKYYD